MFCSTSRRKIFLLVSLHFYGFTSTMSRFGERFRDGKHSLVSFLFAVLLLTVSPRAQPFVKVGLWGTCHCRCLNTCANIIAKLLFYSAKFNAY